MLTNPGWIRLHLSLAFLIGIAHPAGAGFLHNSPALTGESNQIKSTWQSPGFDHYHQPKPPHHHTPPRWVTSGDAHPTSAEETPIPQHSNTPPSPSPSPQKNLYIPAQPGPAQGAHGWAALSGGRLCCRPLRSAGSRGSAGLSALPPGPLYWNPRPPSAARGHRRPSCPALHTNGRTENTGEHTHLQDFFFLWLFYYFFF